MKDTPDNSVVNVQNVRYRWNKKYADVLNINHLAVAPRERLFIQGPSGSGKTTLLNLLAGVITATEGHLSVLGTDLAALNGPARDRFRADHIGFVFQMFNLIPYLSLVENIMLPCRFSKIRRERVQKHTENIADEARRLMSDLQLDAASFGTREVTRLSVGQQQRVAVARALIGRPELVICDEPTSSLDADARQSFLELLFAETKEAGATLILVSHDRSLAHLFDRVIDLSSLNQAGKEVQL